MTARLDPSTRWPKLSLAAWADTYATLHRWLQIVGKTRLALTPMQNHWWNVALYVTSRGLGTSPMPAGALQVEIDFDFIDHLLVARMSDGRVQSFPLTAEPVARFYARYVDMLRDLGVDAHIWPVPMELGDRLRFDEDRVHASYDADSAQCCWRILLETDRVLKEFRARFLGKSSPSHVWWGSFDISCTRFSGSRAPVHPGGIPNTPDHVTREAYSHECISVGWWPGSVGGVGPEAPAFYAYAYPEPPGCQSATIRPAGAYYDAGMHEWILPYDAARGTSDPGAALLEFCESTYEVAASLGHWNRDALERAPIMRTLS